jgi:hypothetical protein
MASLTYTDAVGAVKAWIDSRTATLTGVGNPLQKGAATKVLTTPACFAYLEETTAFQGGGAESPDTYAGIGAQVYGPTRESATLAATALAEELTAFMLAGRPATVTLNDGSLAQLLTADDITGPSWFPDENDTPRLLVQFSVQVRPI